MQMKRLGMVQIAINLVFVTSFAKKGVLLKMDLKK